MTRLIHNSARWGVGYRHRFYIDGRRVTQSVFELEYERLGLDKVEGESEVRACGWRTIWEVK
jgi:hypothetical protein